MTTAKPFQRSRDVFGPLLDLVVILVPLIGLGFYLWGRSFIAIHVVLLLLVIVAAFKQAVAFWWERGKSERWFLGFLAAWLLIEGLWAWHFSPLARIAQGRWAQDVAAVSAFLLSATVMGGVECGVVRLGLAAAFAFLLQLGCAWGLGEPGLLWGNINYLASTATPALFAGLLMYLSGKAPLGRKILAAVVVVVVWLAYAIGIHPTHSVRRGMMLSGVFMVIAFAWYWLFHSRRRLAWAVLGGGVAAIAGGALAVIQHSERIDRLFLYRGAIGQLIDFFPLGGGPFASLRFSECLNIDTQMRLAGGSVTNHAHNELIEAGLNYGVLGLVLFFALAVWLMVQFFRRSSHGGAVGFAALVGLFVHAMVDNSFGQILPEVVVAILLGAFFRREPAEQSIATHVASSGASVARPRFWLRGLTAMLGAVNLFVFLQETPAIFEHNDASLAVVSRVIHTTRNPDIMRMETDMGMRELFETNIFSTMAEELLRNAEAEYRSIGAVRTWYLRILNQRDAVLRAKVTKGFRLMAGTRFAEVDKWWNTVIRRAENDRRLVQTCYTGMERFPFDPGVHLCAFDVLQRRSDLAAECEPRLRMRVGVYGSKPIIPVAVWPAGRETMPDIADVVALIYSDIEGDAGGQVSEEVIRKMARIGGEIDDIAYLVIRWMMVAAKKGTLPEDANALCRRIQNGWWTRKGSRDLVSSHDLAGELAKIHSVAERDSVFAFMEIVTPGFTQGIFASGAEMKEISRLKGL